MTIRTLFLALAIAIFAVPASAREPIETGALGANFNEHYEDIDWAELKLAKASWVRIFLNIKRPPEEREAAMARLLEAKAQGFKVILSLKIPYPKTAFPKPGDARFAEDLSRIDTILPAALGKIDILVIGNEPYIESRKTDRDESLNRYYEAIARHIIEYRNTHCGSGCLTRLYMGALNRIDLADRRSPSADRWMQFVRETPEIDGVDIHPHLNRIRDSQAFLDYILPKMRDDQTFLVTEFSLVHWWRKHNENRVSKAFSEKYGLPEDARVWQVIAAAIAEPVSQAVWNDFLANEPWFASRRFYLRNQVQMFRDTNRLAVATYGFKQGTSMASGGTFTAERNPWLLNSVYAPATVAPDPEGRPQINPFWLRQFRKLNEQE